ncbi:MAG TPA: D-sedoheptulose 7-phosphate isomerase [Xanthobacteraceae bacterium]|nr:D-sedoheptulose 7-phosphate isomerase [Xanthobacteraceae bacterium]
MTSVHEDIAEHFRRSRDTLARAAEEPVLLATISAIAAKITDMYRHGGKLLLAGNGGSAADSQHIAAEFLCRFRFNRAPLPAIALTTDTSVLTAVGNDFGFDQVFERQIHGLGRTGDVFMAITTSGKSPNVMSAIKAAREIGITVVGFTGSGPGGKAMSALCDLTLLAPSEDTAQIQQIHLVAAHAICGLVEQNLFGQKQT